MVMVKSIVRSIVSTAIAVAALSLAAAGGASAATTLTFAPGDVGKSATVVFDGVSDGWFNHSTPVPGLGAELDLSLNAINGKYWTFGYTLTNTSSFPVTSSKVTEFGFDIPDYWGVTSTGMFNKPGTGWVPILGHRDLCFRTTILGGCNGSLVLGLTKGNSASGLFTLRLAATQLDVALSNFFVRYQGINAPRFCLCNQSGVGTGVVSDVPEPSTWAMMITGFGAMGLAMRRRRKVVAATA
jgi:hypothetical protein